MRGSDRILFVVFLACSILVTGYDVYIDNHALQLPIVDRLANPALYPGDPFVDTAPYYASVLWRLVAMLSHLVPPRVQLALLFVIGRILLLVSFRALARAMAPGSRLAEIGAMAFAALAPHPMIADGTIVTSYLEQTGFAIPFFVLSVAAYMRGRPLLCALFLGIGFDLNSLYGTYLITYLVAMMAADGSWRKLWPRGLVAAGVFLLVAAPGIYLSAEAFSRGEANPTLWLWASEVRFSHHLYPWSWGKSVLAEFGLILGLVLAVAWANRARFAPATHALAWCLAALGWLALAVVAPILRIPGLLTAHPGRGCDFWQVLCGVFLIALAARQVEERRVDALLGTATLFAAVVIWFVPPFIMLLAAATAAALLLAVRPASDGSLRPGPAMIVLVVVVALVAPVKRAIWARSPAAAWGWRPDAETLQLADWARHNTTGDAVFLVHPLWSEFRALAQRPVFSTWKDGAAILWSRPFVGEWIARMRVFGIEPGSPVTPKEARATISAGFYHLTDDDVLQMRRQFRIAYWIVPRSHHSDLPIVFETDHFRVLSSDRER